MKKLKSKKIENLNKKESEPQKNDSSENDDNLKNLFVELFQFNYDHYGNLKQGEHFDDDKNASEKIIYPRNRYTDREDFLRKTLNTNIKPKKIIKYTNLNKMKSIKLYQNEQQIYDEKFKKLDDLKSFSD